MVFVVCVVWCVCVPVLPRAGGASYKNEDPPSRSGGKTSFTSEYPHPRQCHMMMMLKMKGRQGVEADGGGRRKEEKERRHTLKVEPSHGVRKKQKQVRHTIKEN